MTIWYRMYHGMPLDPKWQIVARRSGRPRSEVIAVWTVLLDIASQATERGDVADVDAESVAVALDMDEQDVIAILNAFEAKAIVAGGRVTAWDKRQPRREDDSTDRVKAYRERKRALQAVTGDAVTQCNAPSRTVTPRVEESRVDKSSVPNGTGHAEPGASLDGMKPSDGDWSRLLFREGLAWLAHETGRPPGKLRSNIGKWRQLVGDDCRALFEVFAKAQAQNVSDPLAWIEAMVRGNTGPPKSHKPGVITEATWAKVVG